MSQWRDLDAYSPFARVLVTYMWDQYPSLSPTAFASLVGIRRQRLSTWLTTDAVPPPHMVMQVARHMGMPARELLIAAGHATSDDPLFDQTDAWEFVTSVVRRYLEQASADEDAQAEHQVIMDALRAARSAARIPPTTVAPSRRPPRAARASEAD